MSDHQLVIYISEIQHQIEAVRLAEAAYDAALNRHDISGISVAFAATQSFLSAVAMISKLLWPAPIPRDHVDGTSLSAEEKRDAKQRAKVRGETLRRELGEAEVDALSNLQSKEVRNGLEHFDERLDQYLYEAGENANIIDRNIMSPGSIVINSNTSPLTLRNIDPTEKIISVLGDRTNMQSLMSSVDQLANLCAKRLVNSN
jgi:hypothetical protein